MNLLHHSTLLKNLLSRCQGQPQSQNFLGGEQEKVVLLLLMMRRTRRKKRNHGRYVQRVMAVRGSTQQRIDRGKQMITVIQDIVWFNVRGRSAETKGKRPIRAKLLIPSLTPSPVPESKTNREEDAVQREIITLKAGSLSQDHQ